MTDKESTKSLNLEQFKTNQVNCIDQNSLKDNRLNGSNLKLTKNGHSTNSIEKLVNCKKHKNTKQLKETDHNLICPINGNQLKSKNKVNYHQTSLNDLNFNYLIDLDGNLSRANNSIDHLNSDLNCNLSCNSKNLLNSLKATDQTIEQTSKLLNSSNSSLNNPTNLNKNQTKKKSNCFNKKLSNNKSNLISNSPSYLTPAEPIHNSTASQIEFITKNKSSQLTSKIGMQKNLSKVESTNSLNRQTASSDSRLSVSCSNEEKDETEFNDSTRKDTLSSTKLDAKLGSKRDLEFSTSIGQLDDEHNYVHIQNDTTFQMNDEEVSVSVVLNYCKNCVFKPYFRLVSIVGLRPLFGPNTLFNLSQLPLIGCFLSSINILYTLFVLLIILLGYLLQATSCYRQDGLPTFVKSNSSAKKKRDAHHESLDIFNQTLSPDDLSINFKNLNKSIKEYDKLNELTEIDEFDLTNNKSNKRTDKEAIQNLDDDFQTNYLNYQDVYEIGLKNGHISLNKPWWIEKLINKSIVKNFDYNDLNKKKVKKDDEFKANDYINPEENTNSLVCSGNLFTMFILPDLLHLSAYLFTFAYLMRASEIEKTEHLLEKSFLQASQTNGWLLAHRKLVQKLRFFLYLAFSWLIISIINHLLHLLFQTIRFTILDQLTLIYHAPNLQAKLQTPLLVFTIITLIVKDLVCSVIIASYAIHCELNISFIQNLCRSLREKKIELQEFVKGIEEARKFVRYLNNEQSFAVSLLTISISSQLLQAFYKIFHLLFHDESCLITGLLVTVSSVLWLSKLLTPLIQASRLSSTCNELRYIGLELRARPFGYQDTLQEDLDSIVIYTSSLRLKGKIIYCPIKKSFLYGSFAVSVVIILFLGQINYF